MTDDHPPDATTDLGPHDPALQAGDSADEVVGAVLDQEATDDQKAAVKADPGLTARLSAFRSVKSAHLAVAFDAARSDAEAVDRRIAAALDASPSTTTAQETVPETTVPSTAPPAAATVATLRTERSERRQRSLPIFAAAAAVVLLIGIAALAFTTRSNGDDQFETATAEHTSSTATPFADVGGDSASNSAAGSGVAADTAGSGATSDKASATPTPAPDERSLVDLGDFSSLPDLLAAAVHTPSSAPSSLPCPSPFPPGTTLHVSAARLLGQPVVAMIDADSGDTARSSNGQSAVVVLHRSTCAPVA